MCTLLLQRRGRGFALPHMQETDTIFGHGGQGPENTHTRKHLGQSLPTVLQCFFNEHHLLLGDVLHL